MKALKKIYLISNMYPSNMDAVYGIFVKNMVDALAQGNVFIVGYKTLIKGRPSRFIEKIASYVKYYCSIVWFYLFGTFDICYVHFVLHPSPLLVFLYLLKRRVIVYNIHGSDISNLKGLMFLRIVGLALKKSPLIVVPSEYFKNYLTDKIRSINPQKIFISASGGVDLDLFFPKSSYEPREELVIGYVSHVSVEKGWITYLEALRILNHEGIKFRGIVAGKGNKDKVKEDLKNYGLEDRVEFLGPIEHKLLPDLYRSMDVFVFPSQLNESLGLVGIEAMCCGVPIIGSNSGAIPYYIEDEVNGLIFESGNPVMLHEKLKIVNEWPMDKFQAVRENAIKKGKTFDRKLVAKLLEAKLLEISR